MKLKIRHLVIALVIIMSLVVGSSCSLVSTEPPSSSDPTVTPPVAVDTSETLTIADVVALVRPSVVAINTEYVSYDAFNRPYAQQGAGSGWIIDEDGLIVTNNHVVEGADSVTVTLADGRTFSAVSISTDSLSDLAVIRVNAINLPAVKVDGIQIEQVILNLLRNAMEAMADIPARQRLLTLQTRERNKGEVELSVSDTGAGLSDDTIGRMFDAFFTTKPQGMGMGLSLSRSIVEAHKGRLWADAERGEGAMFHLSFPRAGRWNRVAH